MSVVYLSISMKGIISVGDFFALDIGTTSVRVVQLSGSNGAWGLQKYSSVPVDIKIATSDSPEDQKRLAEVITTAIGQSGVRTRNVVLGIPSNRMFATVVDLPAMSQAELANTIKYQAEQFIPMSIDEAKVDWALVGKSLKDSSQVEVLIASVANSFSEQRLDLVEGLGLNVLAIEPDPLALCRALLPSGAQNSHMILDFGDFSTDVVMTLGDSPRLIRSIPTGFRTLVKAAAQNLNIDEQQAAQFISKFGIDSTKLEGQISRALDTTVDQFATELIKSIKFFQTKYPNVPIDSLLLSGYATTIPAFSNYLADKTSLRAELASPWQKVKISSNDQTALGAAAAQFAVAVGLAERGSV